MDQPRALVIGGSLGGLFAANLLRTIGWNVTVFERTKGDLAGRGAGLGTRPELFGILRRIGIDLGEFDRSRGAFARGFPPQRRDDVRGAGALGHHRLGSHLSCARACPAIAIVSLRNAARSLRTGPARKVAAVFEDGSRAEADLLIGADGIHSTVRRQLMPEVTPRYAGYVSWRGVAEEGDGPASFHPMVFHHMTFCFPEGELALSIPIPAPDAASGRPRRRCHFSWFRPVDDETALRRMCTDADGCCHGDSIPPPLIRPNADR